jgi:DNA-binding transcriptional regulator LsrR (DeoR family)
MQSESNEQIHLAARLYYADGWGQTQVAELVRVSQAKVSRLLSLARKRGIVRIIVSDYDSRQRLLEKELIQHLRLKTVIVIKAMDELPITKLRVLVSHFAAPLFESLVPPESILAMGGGFTAQSIIHQLPITSNASTIVQAMGRIGTYINPFDAEELGRSLAEKWQGKFFLLNAPVHVPSKSACENLLKLEQIQNVRKMLERASAALIEPRAVSNSLLADSIGQNEREQIQKAHAVGEICGRYFDLQGNECNTPLKSQTVGIEFETLRKIPSSIGVAVGKEDALAVLSAIRGGLMKVLVTDESTAREILNIASNDSSEKKESLYYHLT